MKNADSRLLVQSFTGWLFSFWCPDPPRCVISESRREVELTDGMQGLCWEKKLPKCVLWVCFVCPSGVFVSVL